MQSVDLRFYGPVCSLTWVDIGDSAAGMAFVVGCVDGSMLVCRRSTAIVSAVHMQELDCTFDISPPLGTV